MMKRFKCILCENEVPIDQIHNSNCPHCKEIVTHDTKGVAICMEDDIIGTQFIECK